MSGTWTPPPPKPHECDLPKATSDKVGWTWRCDHCGKKWHILWKSQYNENWLEWNRKNGD